MGLILIPSEVKVKAAVLKSALNNILAGYQNVVTEINDFANDEALESDTWAKLKEKTLEYHSYISQGMVVVEESISADLSVLEQGIGDEDLYEDELINQINALEAELEGLENSLQFFEFIKSIKLFEVVYDLFRDTDACIYGIKEDIENVKEDIREYEEKLEILYAVEDTTKGLFKSGEQFVIEMGALINEAGVKINHQKVTDAVNTITWDKLSKAIQEQEKETELYIVDVLQEELGISLEELKELYGEESVIFIKEMFVENRINRLEEDSSQKLIEAILSYITDESVIKTGEKYQYIDENGIKRELTKQEVKELLVNQIKIEKLINTAYGEVGTEEEGINRVKYNNWYYRGTEIIDETQQMIPEGERYPWCAVFVCWCADKASMLDDSIPRTEGCARMKSVFIEKGAYHSREEGYEPKRGDIFVHLNENGTGHVGIVVAYDKDNEIIYTIEGNNGDKVCINSREYNSYFDGFGSNGGMQKGTIPSDYNNPSEKDR